MSTVANEKYFQELYTLDGIDWCFRNTDVESQLLKKQYKKGASVYFTENEKNGSLNVYNSSTLIGFINDFGLTRFRDSKENGDPVYGEISSVLDGNEYGAEHSDIRVILSVSNKPRRKKPDTLKDKKKSSLDIIRITRVREEPIKKPRKPSDKHPILQQSFRKQSNLKAVINKQKGKSGIYCIWSRDHKTYIGQSTDIGSRWLKHISDLKSGRHHNHGMQHVWQGKGESDFCFHIIQYAEASELDALESKYINDFKTFEYGYNNTADGQGIEKAIAVVKGELPDDICVTPVPIDGVSDIINGKFQRTDSVAEKEDDRGVDLTFLKGLGLFILLIGCYVLSVSLADV